VLRVLSGVAVIAVLRSWPGERAGVTRRGFLALGGLMAAAGTGCSSASTPSPVSAPSLVSESPRASVAPAVPVGRTSQNGPTSRPSGTPRPGRGATAAGPGSRSSGLLNVVAHPDDDLLFLSPALLVSLASGTPVRTVFLTAGDDGRAAWYWSQREVGIRAAYACMAGVADSWVQVSPDGAPFTVRLAHAPAVRLSFLRLPDGGYGNGFRRYGHQSLPRLWLGEQPRITAVDGSASYRRSDLVDTILKIMKADRPATVRTQDFLGTFGDGDHNDHHAAAYVTRAASDRFGVTHRLEPYQDYPVSRRPANVTGSLLRAKTAAFIAYAAHDRAVCVPGRRSCTRRAYPSWVRRQYRLSVL
jgi:LmbE family N-acetylglucosaminyl deacetylase